jgi:hypothetical protein
MVESIGLMVLQRECPKGSIAIIARDPVPLRKMINQARSTRAGMALNYKS